MLLGLDTGKMLAVISERYLVLGLDGQSDKPAPLLEHLSNAYI